MNDLLERAAQAFARGEIEKAAGLFEDSLRGGAPEAAAGLGVCLQKLARPVQALPYLEKTAPSSLDGRLWAAFGNCLFALSRTKESEAAFRRAIDLAPEDAEYKVLLAHALVRQGQGEEAEQCLLAALFVQPNLVTAHDLMAFLLPQMGRFEEARKHARIAAELDPHNPAYAVRFMYAGKVRPEDREIVAHLERAVSSELEEADRIRVEYGLGKAFEDLEQYGPSFEHYQIANELAGADLNRWGQRFDPSSSVQEVDFLIRNYPRGRLQSARGIESELPVFIVGMMRSGTTLAEQILSSHPQVAGAGELGFWVEKAPQTVGAPPEAIRGVAEQYVRMLEKIAPTKARVCDKMPQNFMSIGPIHIALPKARFIHCRRDPRDTCLSIFTIPFSHHPPFAYSLKNIAFAYRQYQRIMEHWRSALPPELLLEVEYEDLVADQERVTKKMIAFLGLEWDEACLHPERNTRYVNTPSRWQVRQPVYRTSVARWRRFEPWLKGLEDWSDVSEL